MRKPVRTAVIVMCACLAVVGSCVLILPQTHLGGLWLQMRAGKQYMDSLVETNMTYWVKWSDTFFNIYGDSKTIVVLYDEDIPEKMRSLKIGRIDVLPDTVRYMWAGGLDHTGLIVNRMEDLSVEVYAQYDDENGKVLYRSGPPDLPKPPDGMPEALWSAIISITQEHRQQLRSVRTQPWGYRIILDNKNPIHMQEHEELSRLMDADGFDRLDIGTILSNATPTVLRWHKEREQALKSSGYRMRPPDAIRDYAFRRYDFDIEPMTPTTPASGEE